LKYINAFATLIPNGAGEILLANGMYITTPFHLSLCLLYILLADSFARVLGRVLALFNLPFSQILS